MILLMDRIFLSAFPFCEEVCGHEKQNAMPFESQNFQNKLLSNSPPLSHCTFLMSRSN